MRPGIGIIVLTFFISAKVVSQTTIKDVDQLVQKIKARSEHFEKRELAVQGENERYVLLDEEQPRIIKVVEKGRILKDVSWFFKNDTLIYTETLWTDSLTKKKSYEEKTYHYKGSLFAWLNSEHKFMDANSTAFRSLDKKLQVYSAELLDEAKN